jgi:hypothetical protein
MRNSLKVVNLPADFGFWVDAVETTILVGPANPRSGLTKVRGKERQTMKAKMIRHWLLLGACGACLLPGCSSTGHLFDPTGPVYSASHPGPASVTMAPVVAPCSVCSSSATAQPARVTPVAVVAQNATGSPFATVQRPMVASQNAVVSTASAAGQAGTTMTFERSSASLAFVPSEGPEPTLAGTQTAAARLGFEPSVPPGELLPPIQMDATPVVAAEAQSPMPRAEPGLSRRSFVDPTAAPCFGHAPDYSWITGQVEFCHITKEWRLRYTSVDEVDQYGGRIVLVENHHVSLLRDGQYVKLHGHLVNQDAVANGPISYRIESFEAVSRPNQEEADAEQH